MSHTYHFLCVDCGDVLDVGKIPTIDEAGAPVPPTFRGWRDQETGHWLVDSALWVVVERWHILHRGHEVRLVSEAFLHDVDPEGFLRYRDSAAEVFREVVSPVPDDYQDAADMPEETRRRVRALVAERSVDGA